jgi:hypothetical protein
MARHERVYHHFDDLEEYHQGMWRITHGVERRTCMTRAAALMKEPVAFKAAMVRALEEWPNSCEHNLSAENVNRIAWLGHAGCCLGAGSPEEATRAAWHTLLRPEQDEANRAAGEVVADWDNSNAAPAMFQFWSKDA